MQLPTSLFDYDLPERLIAQTPTARRDESRLMVVNRKTRLVEHRHFRDLPEYLHPTDLLFRNNAAVLPARLHAQRPTGGAVECFLLRPAADHASDQWWCLVRPGRKLPVGATFSHEGAFTATVQERLEDGTARILFTTPTGEPVTAIANRVGEVPLPPYIQREKGVGQRAADLSRYQTVYAETGRQVAVAAPTAGLHFTPELLSTLGKRGIQFLDMTLHVGLGTFKPIETEFIEDHPIHREIYEIPAPTQAALFQTQGRRIAVGTTSVRTIEDFLAKQHAPLAQAWTDEAAIYVFPPRDFRGVDGLITNFHQPRSTLMCLVSAFLSPGTTDGIAWLRELYTEAVRRDYRFFSYGDAMLIV